MSETIEAIEGEVNRLRKAYAEAMDKLRVARLEAAPVKAGDLVRRKNGEIGRVSKVEGLSYDQPWVKVNLMRKDGSWGKAERQWFDEWTLATEEAP
jgi:hypothetical protein